VRLSGVPTAVYSSPDSSFFLVSIFNGSAVSIRAFYWSNFGSTNGIALNFPSPPLEGLVLTSVVVKENVHILCLDTGGGKCYSSILEMAGRANQNIFYCGICLEDHHAEDVASIDMCGHLFCRDRMRDYIGSQLSERRFPIACPTCRVTVEGQNQSGSTWIDI
jgi:hypothetical protein